VRLGGTLTEVPPQEIEWVDGYHAEVRSRLTPHLTPEQAEWLRAKTEAI